MMVSFDEDGTISTYVGDKFKPTPSHKVDESNILETEDNTINPQVKKTPYDLFYG